MPVTGSGRRQGYMFAPTSRMRNTYIAAGEDSDSEMIATMGDGLYCRKMGGGSVDPSTGKFNFSVQEGYLVRDGRIVHPVRGASLIGRGSEILHMSYGRIKRVNESARYIVLTTGGSNLIPLDKTRFENGGAEDFWRLLEQNAPKTRVYRRKER